MTARASFARVLLPVWLVTAAWDFMCASALSALAYHTSLPRLWRGVAATALGPLHSTAVGATCLSASRSISPSPGLQAEHHRVDSPAIRAIRVPGISKRGNGELKARQKRRRLSLPIPECQDEPTFGNSTIPNLA